MRLPSPDDGFVSSVGCVLGDWTVSFVGFACLCGGSGLECLGVGRMHNAPGHAFLCDYGAAKQTVGAGGAGEAGEAGQGCEASGAGGAGGAVHGLSEVHSR